MACVGKPKMPAEKLLPAAATNTMPALYAMFTASAQAAEATPPMLIEINATRSCSVLAPELDGVVDTLARLSLVTNLHDPMRRLGPGVALSAWCASQLAFEPRRRRS